MPTYRYWYLDDKENPETDEDIEADDASEAASLAVEEMINDGDCDLPSSHKIELAIRMIKPELADAAEMFEVFVDWSPSCTAYSRGTLPKS